MIALARAELLKLRSTRTALGLFIVILVVTLVPLTTLIFAVPKDWLETDGVTGFLNTASALVPLVLLVFGVLGMTNEYRHGTITYSYLVTPRRWQVMAMKLVVYAVVGIMTMVVAVILVYVVIRIGGAIRGVSIDATGGSTLGDYARQIVVAGLITTFGVALGALFRAQVITVAGVLIWALAVENIIVILKPAIGRWLPFTVFDTVSAGQVSGGGATDMLSRPQAFIVSIVYIAIVSVAAVFISLRRDVTEAGVDGSAKADEARGRLQLRIHGPLLGQGAAAERILRALPGWFGIESALVEYAQAADELPTLVAGLPGPSCDRVELPGDHPDRVVGFVTLKETSEDALELHVMGVLPAWRRRGAGRALVERAASYARAEGFSLLHVKTLAPSHPDPGYAATRAFYAAAGFRPLEVITEVWGPDDPCLLMVRPL